MEYKNFISILVAFVIVLSIFTNLRTMEQNNNQIVNINQGSKVDLSTATKEEIKSIPDIGELAANEIINYRDKNKINSEEDLRKVLGYELANKIKPYIK